MSSLELDRQVRYHEYSEKVVIYREVANVVADIIVDISSAIRSGQYDASALEAFERRRLRLYGYLGIAAPQSVMTELDTIMDELLDMMDSIIPYDFARVRELAYNMLNAIRVDVALDKDPIRYTGHR